MLIAQCQFRQNYLEIRVGIFDLEKPKEVGANEHQSTILKVVTTEQNSNSSAKV